MNTKANPLTKEIDLKKNANTNLIYKKHNTQHDHPHHTTTPREKKDYPTRAENDSLHNIVN